MLNLKLTNAEEKRNNIASLYREGLKLRQIAQRLKLTLSDVSNNVYSLIHSGELEGRQTRLSKDERRLVLAKIAQLRQDGLAATDITTQLSLPATTVGYFIQILVKQGTVKKLQNGRKTLSKVRLDNIVKLAKKGLGIKEIASEERLSYGTVRFYVLSLRDNGEISDDVWKSMRKYKSDPRSLDDERVQTIIQLRKNLTPYKKIGKRLGVSGERARQLVNSIIAKHGEKIFEPNEKFWSLAQLTTQFKVSRDFVLALCQEGKIPHIRHGEREYLFNNEGIKALEKILEERCSKTCPICGQKGKWIKYCSKKCRRVSNNQSHAAPTNIQLSGWHKELSERLAEQSLPEEEDWITFAESCKRTGMSKMQISWLRTKQVIATKALVKKSQSKRTLHLYSATHIRITGEVYADFCSREASKKQ